MEQQQVYELIETHYREEQPRIVARIGRYLKHRANAEDVVQEAYLRMIKYWKAYDGEQEIGKWFGSILNNTIKDFFKKEMVHGMEVQLPQEEAPFLEPSKG